METLYDLYKQIIISKDSGKDNENERNEIFNMIFDNTFGISIKEYLNSFYIIDNHAYINHIYNKIKIITKFDVHFTNYNDDGIFISFNLEYISRKKFNAIFETKTYFSEYKFIPKKLEKCIDFNLYTAKYGGDIIEIKFRTLDKFVKFNYNICEFMGYMTFELYEDVKNKWKKILN